MFNVRWKGILVLALAWFAFLFLQILKVCLSTDSSPLFCSTPLSCLSNVAEQFRGLRPFLLGRQRPTGGRRPSICLFMIEVIDRITNRGRRRSQFPVALSVFGWEAAKLWRESRERRRRGNWECVCEASIEWTATQLLFCAFCGLLGGTVGGLLGSGGGFILGPLFLEIGVIPQVRIQHIKTTQKDWNIPNDPSGC